MRIYLLSIFITLSSIASSQQVANATRMQFEDIEYLLSFPNDYSEENEYPTIIFLHGGDGSNTKHHPSKYAAWSEIAFPFIVIAPSCNSGCSWSNVDLPGIIDQATGEASIDKNRIYLVGYSMGGAGTWANLKKMSGILAAAAPLAPAGGSTTGLCDAKDLPIRVYHGTADGGYDRSKNMVTYLKDCGSVSVELISLEGKGHGIWPGIFSDNSFYEWLLEQRKVK